MVPGPGFGDLTVEEQLGRLSQEKSHLGALAAPRLASLAQVGLTAGAVDSEGRSKTLKEGWSSRAEPEPRKEGFLPFTADPQQLSVEPALEGPVCRVHSESTHL